LNILEIYKIAGIFSSILFFISIFIIRYYFLNKSNKYSVLVISIFVSVFIFSSGSLLGERWLLYLIPFVVFFNTLTIVWILRHINFKKVIILLQIKKRIVNPSNLKIAIASIFIGFLSIEPSLYLINPPFSLGPDFGKIEENLYENIQILPNESYIFTTYKMNRFLNAFAINKTLLYTTNKTFLHFYEITKADYYNVLNQSNYSILSRTHNSTTIDYFFLVLTRSDFPEQFDNYIHLASQIIYNDTVSAILEVFL
ncbi:MAG: hypothetical protein ACFFEY_20105, partial [Candidatus Thorarchaeota archaeon]